MEKRFVSGWVHPLDRFPQRQKTLVETLHQIKLSGMKVRYRASRTNGVRVREARQFPEQELYELPPIPINVGADGQLGWLLSQGMPKAPR